jgi:general secretion pathway protein D
MTSDGSVATAGVFDPMGTFSTIAGAVSPLATLVDTSNLKLAGAANFPAVLKALQSNGALNVLSTPNIMTSDNKEAEIFVGENVPFITSTNLSSTGLSQQGIERKDTGITLKIKPMISEGQYVKLDVYQEISAVKDALNKGAAADITTTKRSAKTSITVKDSDTVVIGGLIQDQDQETISKIPFLGDIPVLGWLFKTKSLKRTKTNLLIVLTPYIVRDSVDMGKVSEIQKGKFSEQLKSDQPIDFDKELKVKATP